MTQLYRPAGNTSDPEQVPRTPLDNGEPAQTGAAWKEADHERYRRALEAAGVGTWEWHLPTDALRMDEAEAALTGRTPDVLTTATAFFACVHPDDAEALQQNLQQVLETGAEYGHEFRVLLPNGTIRWLAGRGRVVCDADGQPERMFGVNYDVTSRKEAEIALREREAQFREVSALLSDYAYSVRVLPGGGTEREWTTGNFEQVTTYSAEEYDAAGGVQAHLHPDDGEAFERWTEALLRGETATAELRIRTRDGSYRWISNRARVEFGPEGQPVRVVGASNDITSRKEAEQALREREGRYRTLFSSIDEGFSLCEMIVDESGRAVDYRFIEVNGVFEEMTGLANAAGHTARELVPGLEDYWIETYARVGLGGESLRLENGSEAMGRWFDVYASPFGPKGSGKFAVVFKDITRRREAERNAHFIAELERALQPLTNPDALMATTARMLGEHLAADRCAYATVEADENHFFIPGDYTRGDARSIVGHFAFSDFGAEVLRLMRENQPYVVHDIDAEAPPGLDLSAYRQTQIQAVVCVPLHKNERLVAAMAVHQTTPRRWSPVEIETVVTVVNRCWESLERARAEEALRTRTEEFAALADNIPQLAWMAEADGALFWYNQRWYDYTGTTPEEMMGWGWQKVHHPDYVEPVTVLFKTHVESGEPWEDTFPLRGRDGRFRWFLSRAYPIRDESGHIVRWFGTNTDVTEQREMEEALRASETRFRSMADAAPAMLWVTDAEGQCTFLSEGWYEFTGQTEATGLGLGWTDAVHPDDRELAGATFLDASARRISFAFDYRLRRADGTYRWAVDAGRPRFAPDGTFLGFVGSVFDITDRKEAEEALRKSENHFRQLAEAIPDIVYTSDELGRVDYLNGSWYRYTGHGSSRDLSAAVAAALHPDDARRLEGTWGRAFADGQPFEAEIRLRRHDGAYHWFITRVVPVRDDDGDVVRWFGTSTDIHAQKALEAELEGRVAARTAELAEANQALELRNRELQEFAYAASHDLQEPLRKIRTFADLLAADFGEGLPDEAHHYMSRMQSAAGRMSSLISALLTFSRVSTHSTGFSDVDLNETVRLVLSDLEMLVRETGGTVEVEPLPTIEADSTQMQQLLQNLIGNALKYRRDEVPLRVCVRARIEPAGESLPGEVCRIEVEDNGIGFEEKYADRIFAPFQRLHGRSQYEGTGIGLAICRRIAERHRGRITVRSKPGEGSTFVVKLPVRQPDPEGA